MQFNFVEEDIIKLSLSLVAGAIIGAEREYNNKNAGFRTIILVTVGATLFTMLSLLITGGKDYHVVGNIVVGIGFLGAGSIFKEGATVRGLTTAATIWIASAVGMAVGAGQYALAVIVLSIIILVLLGLRNLQNAIDRFNREKTYKITVPNNQLPIAQIFKIFSEFGLQGECLTQHKINDTLIYVFEVKGKEANHDKLIQALQKNEQVIEFEV